MALFPSDPPPEQMALMATQPSGKSRSINGVRSQVRGSGVFIWGVKVSYAKLDFDQRNELTAFILEQEGRVAQFDVILPTYSENSNISNTTATSSATYPIGAKTITLNGMVGELKKMNLLRINGQKATYAVTSAGVNSAGSQTVNIRPPLRTVLPLGSTVLTKNVPLNMSVDSDMFKVSSIQMSASFSIPLIEEV